MFHINAFVQYWCVCTILMFSTDAPYWCFILMFHTDALYWCPILMRLYNTDALVQYWCVCRMLMRLYNIDVSILYCSKISIWGISIEHQYKTSVLYKRINIQQTHQYCTSALVLYKRINIKHQYETSIWNINIKRVKD